MRNQNPLKYTVLYCLALLVIAIAVSFVIQGEPDFVAGVTDSSGIVSTDDKTVAGDDKGASADIKTENTPQTENQQDDPIIVEAGTNPWVYLTDADTELISEMVGDKCLIIKKPEAAELGIVFTLEESPVDRSIKVTLSGCDETELSARDIKRIASGYYYEGTPSSVSGGVIMSEDEADPLQKVTFHKVKEENKTVSVTIDLTLDSTYAYHVYEDTLYYYLDLKHPMKVYDKIVVLDAGHGGWDTGTYSEDLRYLEKDINLKVVLHLKELLEQEEGIKLYLTRTTDRKLTIDQRVELANHVGADLFLSVHCNNSNNSISTNGTEVLFSELQNSNHGFNSRDFAMICLEEVVGTLQLKNLGLVASGADIAMLQNTVIPVALVELGYMSNPGDLTLIKSDEIQKNIAQALYKAIMRSIEVIETQVIEE